MYAYDMYMIRSLQMHVYMSGKHMSKGLYTFGVHANCKPRTVV